MKFASLGSGSEGNALLISTQSGMTQTTVMLDCGFTIRETERRLARLDMMPGDLAGIIVTHEHHDHVSGVFKFARRHKIPVWFTYGTYQAVVERCDEVEIFICRDSDCFQIRELEISPYTVPHDAREPVQYVVSNGVVRLGVLTDAGHGTPHMLEALGGCDALILECNHDLQMLADSTYPPSLKYRISSDYGHLSNEAASEILHKLDKSRLKRVVGAHLSSKNNTEELARNALVKVTGSGVELSIACQQDGFDWIHLSSR